MLLFPVQSIPYVDYFGLVYRMPKSTNLLRMSGLRTLIRLNISLGRASIGVPVKSRTRLKRFSIGINIFDHFESRDFR